jgi:RNA polymerase sigma-70 factor (ECF subfamily)
LTPEEELRFVKAAKKGDASAFEALVLANEKLIYNVALKLTGNPDDALDVSQDTFLKAYSNISSFRGDSRFSAWLYRLCYNACMDFLKKTRNSNVSSMTAPDGSDIQYDIPDPGPLPDETLERHELQRKIHSALMTLSEDKREIIVMREFSCMTYTDIADALKIEEGTVKSRLSRARLALAEILKKDGTFLSSNTSNGQKGGRRRD